MLREDFGQNVRYYRKEKKLTLEAAAEVCDISSRYLGRIERGIERGKASVGIDKIEKISKGLERTGSSCRKTAGRKRIWVRQLSDRRKRDSTVLQGEAGGKIE